MAHQAFSLIQQELEVMQMSQDKIHSILATCGRDIGKSEHQLAQANAYVMLTHVAMVKQKMVAHRYKALAESIMRYLPPEREEAMIYSLEHAQDISDEGLMEQVNKELQMIGAFNNNEQGSVMNQSIDIVTNDFLAQLIQNWQMARQQSQHQQQPMTPESFDWFTNTLTYGSEQDIGNDRAVEATASVPPPTTSKPQTARRSLAIHSGISFVREPPPKKKRSTATKAKPKSKTILAPASASQPVKETVKPEPTIENGTLEGEEMATVEEAIVPTAASQHPPPINPKNNLRQTDLTSFLIKDNSPSS